MIFSLQRTKSSSADGNIRFKFENEKNDYYISFRPHSSYLPAIRQIFVFQSSLEILLISKSANSRILLIFAMKPSKSTRSHFLISFLCSSLLYENNKQLQFSEAFLSAGMFTSFDILQQQNSIESDWRRGNPRKLCVGRKWKSFSSFSSFFHPRMFEI